MAMLSRLEDRRRSSVSSVGLGHSRKSSVFDLLVLLRRRSSRAARLHPDAFDETDAFLSSDGDDDDRQLSREKILEKIREKKEVIDKVRCQPWSMRRKKRTLKLAHKFLERHEAKVSKSHMWKVEAAKQWKRFKRWLSNISTYLIPWENKIKSIESHFGSVVSSYFTFVRWIFWMNLIMSVLSVCFIVIPEILGDLGEDIHDDERLQRQKTIHDPEVRQTATYLQTIWDFEGFVRVSPLFYGFYAKRAIGTLRYKLPLAYFIVYLCVLGYSFWIILRKMAANARLTKLAAGKQEQYTFSWKVFTGWDFTIGHHETASNTVASNTNKLKESIVEYRVKHRQAIKRIVILIRIMANIAVLCLVAASTFAVYTVVERSRETPPGASFLRKNEVPIVVSLITLFFPNIFDLIGMTERYHPRNALRMQLGRILLLYLLNFYTLIFSLMRSMQKINEAAGRNDTDVMTTIDTMTTTSDDAMVVNRFVRQLLVENATQLAATTALSLAQLFNIMINKSANSKDKPPTMASTESLEYHTRTMTSKMSEEMIQKILNFTDFVDDGTRTSRIAKPEPNLVTQHPKYGKIGVINFTAHLVDASATTTRWPRPDVWSPPHVTTTGHTTEGDRPTSAHTSSTESTITDSAVRSTIRVPLVRTDSVTNPPRTMDRRPTPDEKEAIIPATDSTSAITTAGVKVGGVGDRERDRNGQVNQLGSQAASKQRIRTNLIHDCWETYLGQEICRLITMDLVMTFAAVIFVDFFRGLWVRYCNRWWCWDLECQFPEYGEFKVAENVLHVVNNQGMIWLGLFFSPLLPAVNNVKLLLVLYLRSWACMSSNVPAAQVFRASRSNNFYLLLLLLMLFLCTLPVGYVIASQKPSHNCGPFWGQDKFYHVVTDSIKDALPENAYSALNHIASPGIIIPVLLLMVLVIYFLVSLSRALKESNEDLKKQLNHERTEEKRKVYAMAGGKVDRPAFGPSMPETKKIDVSHLPNRELRKRDHWTTKNLSGTDSATNPDSEDSTTDSPDTPGSARSPEATRTPLRDVANNPPRAATAIPTQYIPSLKTLPEENTLMTSGSDSDQGRRPTARIPSDSSMKIYNVPPLATPERTSQPVTPSSTSTFLETPDSTEREDKYISPYHSSADLEQSLISTGSKRETHFPVYIVETEEEEEEEDDEPDSYGRFPPIPPPITTPKVNFLSPSVAFANPESRQQSSGSGSDNKVPTMHKISAEDLEKMLQSPAFSSPAPPLDVYQPAYLGSPTRSRNLKSNEEPSQHSSSPIVHSKPNYERSNTLPYAKSRHDQLTPSFTPWPTTADGKMPTKSILKPVKLSQREPSPNSKQPRFHIIQSPTGSDKDATPTDDAREQNRTALVIPIAYASQDLKVESPKSSQRSLERRLKPEVHSPARLAPSRKKAFGPSHAYTTSTQEEFSSGVDTDRRARSSTDTSGFASGFASAFGSGSGSETLPRNSRSRGKARSMAKHTPHRSLSRETAI